MEKWSKRKFQKVKTRSILRNTQLTLFLTLFFVMQLSASVYSQGTKMNISEHNQSLIEVFEQIRSKSEYTFVYDLQDVENVQNINLSKKDATLDEILYDCLENTNLSYTIVDKTVIIKRAKENQQDEQKDKKPHTITGTVFDEDGNPIPGVSIVLKGTNIGVATDIQGKYTLEFQQDKVEIEYSFVGMTPQTIPYKGQQFLNVTMQEDKQLLDEVVVTGYQTISKERATGSFDKVSSKQLDDIATSSIIDKLEGQASGVLFDRDGNITIRGIASMNASTDPLIVMDGFPIEEDMESINPNDIESVTVLKDAAAASIWGARASNGVIVITSKKGTKKGKPQVSFYSTVSITPKPDLYSLKRASAKSFLEVEKHIADNKWDKLAAPTAPDQPPYNEGLYTYLLYNDGQINEAEKDATTNRLKDIDVRDEYSDLFLHKSIRKQYHLSVSGTNDITNYYASLSYEDNATWQKGVDNDRIISNLRMQTKISNRITFNGAVSATLRNSDNNSAPILGTLASYQQILDTSGNYVPQPWAYSDAGKAAYAKANNSPYNWTYNAYQEYKNANNETKNIDVRLQTGLNIDLAKGLSLEGRYQYEWSNIKNQNIYNENTYYTRNEVNMYAYQDADGTMIYPIPKGEIRSDINSYTKAFTTRAQLNFDRSFNDNKHNVYAIGGVEFRETISEASNMTKYGYDPVSLQYSAVNYNTDYNRAFSNTSSKITDDTNYSYVKNRYASYYGNTGYTFLDKYTITGSVRLDDSNLFGASKEYRNVPLWSIGANWHLYKENFMNTDFINRLTLRATYGTGGNIDKTTSPYLTASVTKDWQNQHQFAYISNPKNPNLRWEKTKTANIGIDYAVWNNRISGSIEYYNRKSIDLLGNVSINALYGFSSAKMNFAEMSNKGFDFSVNVNILNKAVHWNAIGTLSYNKNNVEKVELSNETVSGALFGYAREDKPLYHLYSYNWAGLSDKGMPQIYNEKGKIIDHNTPMESIDGLKYEGTLTPKYYGSLRNIISYKDLQLSMLITYKLGHKFRAKSIDYYNVKNGNSLKYVHSDIDKRWRQPGDEKNTNIAVLPNDLNTLGGYWEQYIYYGSQLVKDASHIRFTNIALSYNLPKTWCKSIGLNIINLGVQVRNFGVITFNNDNIDPENIITTTGYGKNRPEFTFSLKATF